VGDCLFSLAQALVAGFTVNCPESGDTVLTDLREIGPTYYFAPPRVFENMLTTVMIRMEDAGAIKRRMFAYFMDVAKRCGAAILDGKPVAVADRIRYAAGHVLVYGPLKNVLGLSRVRVAYTAGAAIGPDLFRFYRSIGVNLKQLYGSTETCAYVCLQPDGNIKFDSVGLPAPGVEVKLADNGEVLVKSAATMDGYFKRPDATAEVIDQDGYFHTGDAGIFDAEGHLKIIDRAADVGKMSQGAIFAPNPSLRPTTSRTSSSSSLLLRRRSPSAMGASRCAPSSISTWKRWATGPSGATSRMPATPTWPRTALPTTWCASAWRRSTPTWLPRR
jgi:long-chain acyl-CoA synthetase